MLFPQVGVKIEDDIFAEEALHVDLLLVPAVTAVEVVVVVHVGAFLGLFDGLVVAELLLLLGELTLLFGVLLKQTINVVGHVCCAVVLVSTGRNWCCAGGR